LQNCLFVMTPLSLIQAAIDDVRKLRLRTKLGVIAVVATTGVLALTAFGTLSYLRDRLFEVQQDASNRSSDAVAAVLQAEMVSGDRTALASLVEEIGTAKGVNWVGVMDWRGRVRQTSLPERAWRTLDETTHDCGSCHSRPAGEQLKPETIVLADGLTERRMIPLENRPICHRCHDPDRRVNGLVIVDRTLVPIQSAVRVTTVSVLVGGMVALLVLLGTLGIAIERHVLGRLRGVRQAAARVGEGDLAARAPVQGKDEIDDLATGFNGMAARLEGAIAALAHERNQLDQIVNGIGDGILLLDPNLNIVSLNRAFLARTPPGQLPRPGAPHSELVRAAGVQLDDGVMPAAKVRETGKSAVEMVRVIGPRGERYEEISAQPLRAPDGSLSGIIAVWRDVTDRKQLEVGLEQSERLAQLGMIASGVAHEVGNPLASIITAVEGLLSRMEPAPEGQANEVREYLEIIRKQVLRCKAVTERLLGFARVPSSEITVVDVAAAVREVVGLIAPHARSQNVEVRWPNQGSVYAMGVDLLLEQVFLNLAINAMLVMPKGGTLAFDVTEEGEAVRVSVSDTGPGIAEEVRRHLFEPFRSARKHGPGTGLGLFLSQTLISRCGGTIRVKSELGYGTTFTVELRGAGAARGATSKQEAGNARPTDR
jgi:signal transduction histidine kinase/HAMP domain-containing protein